MQVYTGTLRKCVIATCAVGFSLTLGGCSALDGVDVTLPFVGNVMAKTKRGEVELRDRGNLLIPPSVARQALPEPGQARQNSAEAWPDDPDLRAKRIAALKKAKKDKEIRNGNFKSYDGIDGFERATDSFKRQESLVDKYYRKKNEKTGTP